jgi:beta-phosphoglucomutase
LLRAVVFDFDGVIANSEPLHHLAFRDVLAQAGVELSKEEYYGQYL